MYLLEGARKEEFKLRILYDILNVLYSNGAKSKLIALTQKQIQSEVQKDDGETYNERTIYSRLQELKKKGYIEEGLRIGNAKSFYISKAGIDWIVDIEKEVDEKEED